MPEHGPRPLRFTCDGLSLAADGWGSAEHLPVLLLHGGGQTRHAWGDTMGFVAGWSELLVTRGFSGASKAVLIATYICLFRYLFRPEEKRSVELRWPEEAAQTPAAAGGHGG